MTEVGTQAPQAASNGERIHIVDTDVHERADLRALLPYLDPIWRKYITDFEWQPDRVLPFAQYAAGGLDRVDAKLPDGSPGGSDYGLMRKQLLDEYDMDFAVLTGWLDASALTAMYAARLDRPLGTYAVVREKFAPESPGHLMDR